MIKSYKYRLYPNKEQEEYFSKCFGCCRFIWNEMLNDKINYYQETKQQLKNTPAQYKKEFEWLNEVDSLALANVQLNLQQAFKNFFKNPKFGYPKFKCKKNNHQAYTTNNQGGNIRIIKDQIYKHDYIKLPKIGNVKIKLHRQLPINGSIKSVTISRTPSLKYYVSILCEYEKYKNVEPTGAILGIDLGLKNFLTTSEGQKIDNPKFYEQSQKKLARAQRRLSRKPKDSKNREKVRIKVARISEKITNQRDDFLHKLSKYFVNNYDFICCEDLNIKGMIKNRKLSKNIQDVSWSKFLNILNYKMNWEGKHLVKINTFFPSSKTCSNCICKKEDLTLDIREWNCPNCGTHHDRDINAAKNILNEGLRIFNS